MAETNMDTKGNKDAVVPVLEFRLPVGEVDDMLEVGEFGSIVVPVEVVNKSDGAYTFRKHGQAKTDGSFRTESLPEMRSRLLDQQKDD